MKYTKNKLSEMAEAIRTYEHNDNPEATKVILREVVGNGDTLLSLKIYIDTTKITNIDNMVFMGSLGIQNLLRKLLGADSVTVEDMAVAVYNETVHIVAYIWIK